MRRLLHYKSSLISYIRFGTGSRAAICFHGYGEQAESFSFLEKYAGSYYTFFCIDLPFHGSTEWKEGLKVGVSDLIEIIDMILNSDYPREPAISQRPLTLIGFSLGGRMALSIYERIPSRVERMVLLAPDGLKVNFWYWLSTQTWAGNKLFALTMKHPGWFFGFLKMLNKSGLVNASIFKFVTSHLGDEEVRRLLYARWTSLRTIWPRLGYIRTFILTNNTSVRLIYGMHDRIILPARGEKFRKGIEKNCTLSIIHSGHQVLHEKHVQDILDSVRF